MENKVLVAMVEPDNYDAAASLLVDAGQTVFNPKTKAELVTSLPGLRGQVIKSAKIDKNGDLRLVFLNGAAAVFGSGPDVETDTAIKLKPEVDEVVMHSLGLITKSDLDALRRMRKLGVVK